MSPRLISEFLIPLVFPLPVAMENFFSLNLVIHIHTPPTVTKAHGGIQFKCILRSFMCRQPGFPIHSHPLLYGKTVK